MSWYFYKTDVNFNSGLRVWPLSHGAYRLLHTYYAIARQAARPGYVESGEGQAPTAAAVCRLAGAGFTPAEIPGYDRELEAAGHLEHVTSVWRVTGWKTSQGFESQTTERNRIRQQIHRQKGQIPPHVTSDVTNDVSQHRSRSRRRSRSRSRQKTQDQQNAIPPTSAVSPDPRAGGDKTNGAGHDAPSQLSRKKTPWTREQIRGVVDAYATVKGFAETERNLLYRTCVKSACLLLEAAAGDLGVIGRGMTEIGAWLNRGGFAEWTLQAVVKHWPQWRTEDRAEGSKGRG